MFPIRDHNPSQRPAYVTWALIAANLAVFVLTLPLEGAPSQLWLAWALYPAEVTTGTAYGGLLTAMFLHAGILHLGGNMLFLWVFGDNLEEALGHLGFLLFYLASGVAAAAAQIAGDPMSPIPMVGASGAIAGVMGGYLLFFPRARVDVLFIIVILIRVVPIPAWIVLGVWFGLQVLNGAMADPTTGGVAYWAHAGGFGAGLLLALPAFLRRGGPAFWSRTHGVPPHPAASYSATRIPAVRRRK
ncbi:rhomboid family intramembrane serine protease [Rhodobacter veldkampii DSM 11550]|uniref:Rhomboid family intramembrane serine protease n=1 Tax=Phaeovulum veldkampii DSM 11550 TaxID=1185920 RepID=A0A2T4JN15_9RHOB|nr:rhomboid family intramembrane serine protease [Phaeovulum veldkampii]MBK5945170.1 rhomboid family intramembrane serine protease [Phaeovulum veldkampii DSM 11550]NCU20972.1 rhomboid family intramembrane serine protease [Candidatus Falkowbacteria bacterium]PTE19309.1 rhomboid family intramembrane serine protease [Phaeovulum veldkampii DSM 11550]TDQ62200.1 membrane associated rhomboid family serine protease [Phaeovulum veldkampii DSM 11550]